jgi:hypothetical protein
VVHGLFGCLISTVLIWFIFPTIGVGNEKQAFFSVFFAGPGSRRRTPIPLLLRREAQGGNHPEARYSEAIAKPRIELRQRVCSVLLILNRKIFPVAAYLAAAPLKRFWIANIARMQDV